MADFRSENNRLFNVGTTISTGLARLSPHGLSGFEKDLERMRRMIDSTPGPTVQRRSSPGGANVVVIDDNEADDDGDSAADDHQETYGDVAQAADAAQAAAQDPAEAANLQDQEDDDADLPDFSE